MNKLAILAFVSIAMVSGLANGAEWGQYGNARFGYWIDIPPRFSAITEADNGDGGISQSSDGSAELRVWGRHLVLADDFQAEATRGIDKDVESGWNITYQKQQSDWVSWSGTKDGRTFYQRAIPACNNAIAFFRLEYEDNQKEAFHPVVERLAASLRRQCG
uniref:hypothetical protein n=1 Tax=Halomonas sp. TaxID=1486246 RepID=UPI002637CE38|nr:hypothetical protein [Halomonas sp.]